MKNVTVAVAIAIVIAICPVAHAADGAAIFKAKCALCHAADGSGDTPMGKKVSASDLRGKVVQARKDAELIETVAKGRKKMPAWPRLSQDEIKAVVGHVRMLATK